MATLHIRCGSDIRQGLAEAGLKGDFLEFSDPVCRGLVPATDDPEAFREARLDYVCGVLGLGRDEALAKLREGEEGLARLNGYERIVLWFEHDIYDQALLIRLLTELDRRPELHDRLEIVQTDRFPGVDRFIGLGQLSPDQLAALWPQRMPVTADQRTLAVRAWDAFRAPAPEALMEIVREADPALPFLSPALERHLQDLPWTRDGLTPTERLTLRAIDEGAETAGRCFAALQRDLELQPFLGDTMYWHEIAWLARAPEPAVGPIEDWKSAAALTDFGRRLLAGEADWIAANGIDRGHGGIRLTGTGPHWRWDDKRGAPRLA